MLDVQDLTVAFGNRTLFEDVSLQLYPEHRYGLVGANGAGKSTLLSVLCGHMQDYSGTVQWPASVQVGVLEQDHFQYEDQSLLTTVLQGREKLWQALQTQHLLSQKSDFTPEDTETYTQAQLVIDQEHGYAAESEAARLLSGLGLRPEQHQGPLSALSGGYKLRVLMARLLFSQPQALLLDEPTNHLDLYAIKWLGEYLSQYRGLLVVISHDRTFLNEVCTDILDVDYGAVKIYSGNYDAFVNTKELLAEQLDREIEKQAQVREETERFINRFRAKATKASAVQSRVKMLERMDQLEKRPSSRRYPHFGFETQQRSGTIALRVKDVSKAFDTHAVLNQVSFEVERGDRVALIGPNGVGKSTLLKILMADLEADQGSIEWGHQTDVGYFPQDYHQILPAEQTPYGWLAAQALGQPEAELRKLLGRVLFTGEQVKHKIMTLSGGEATRLVFSRLMLRQDNVLILDEPTNHLDMEAIDALAEALNDYAGTLICVSHNRFFVESIANRILELTPDGFNDFRGTYQEYLQKQGVDHLEVTHAPKAVSEEARSQKEKNQLNYEEQKKQQRQLRALERKIPELAAQCDLFEQKLATLTEALAEAYVSGTPEDQARLLAQQEEQQAALDACFAEWEAAELAYEELL